MDLEDKLITLAQKLKPSPQESNKYSVIIDDVAKILDNNKEIKKQEIWRCGSVGKGTSIKFQSDFDIVVVMSPYQDMTNILELLRKSLQRLSTPPPEIKRKAVTITIKGISTDVVPTQYGISGPFHQAQYSKKEVSEVIGQGDIFKDVARILKYWRDLPINAPNTGNIPSFAIEVILAKVFRDTRPQKRLEALINFFKYINSWQLTTSLGLHDNHGNTIVTYEYNFDKKKFFLDQAQNAYRLITNSQPDLSFIGIN